MANQAQITSRRQLLGQAAAAGTIGSVATVSGVLAGEIAQPHPDALLLEAFEHWLATNRAKDADPDDSDERRNAYFDLIFAAEEGIAATRARTAAGLAVKLRVLFSADRQSAEACAFIVHGKPLPEGYLAEDCWSRLTWSLLQDVERMAQEARA